MRNNFCAVIATIIFFCFVVVAIEPAEVGEQNVTFEKFKAEKMKTSAYWRAVFNHK